MSARMPVVLTLAFILILQPGSAQSQAGARQAAPWLTPLGQTGGATQDSAVAGGRAYVSAGARVAILDVADPANAVLLGQTIALTRTVYAVDVAGHYLYAAALEAGLFIFDVADPAAPVLSAHVPCDMPITWVSDVVVSGAYAYVMLGNAGLEVYDVSDPANPARIAFVSLPGALRLTLSGSVLYVADWGNYRFVIFDVTSPAAPVQLAGVQLHDYVTDVAVAGSYAYVAASNEGVFVYDVSDPAHPVQAGVYDSPLDALGLDAAAPYLYVADFTALRVVDVSDPAQPVEVSSWESPGDVLEVTVSGHYAYVADSYGGLRILDVADPAQPLPVGSYSAIGDAQGVALSGAYAYVADGNNGLTIVDASSPARLVPRGNYPAPGTAYNVRAAGNYAYLADGTGGLRIVDVSDPAHPAEAGVYGAGADAGYMDVALGGAYAYVADTRGGLRVIDVSDPANPFQTGFWPGYGLAALALDGRYLYASSLNAVYVFDVADAAHPVIVGSWTPAGANLMYGLAVKAPYLYVTDYVSYLEPGYLVVLDVSDPAHPVLFSYAEMAVGLPQDVTLGGDYAFVTDASYTSGLQVIDVSDPRLPALVARSATLDSAYGAAVSGPAVYVASSDGGLMSFWYGAPGQVFMPVTSSCYNQPMASTVPPDFSAYGVETVWLNPRAAQRTLLIAYPHPDDESFGNAGSVARYAAEGVAVHYACATRGEVGTVSPDLLGDYPDIGALRSHELACASASLGMAAVHFLNYRDSGMPGSEDNRHPRAFVQAPLEEVAGKLVALMRALHPQVVITFPPYGGYGHPDHIRIHYATLAAWEAVGDPARYPEQIAAGLAPWQPSKLYYSTFGMRMLNLMMTMGRFMGQDMRHGGRNKDIDFVEAARQATPVTTRIDTGAYIDQKVSAWQCHGSQLEGMAGVLRLPRQVRRWVIGTETFTRAIPAWDGRKGEETDLFAGVSE